MGSWLFGGGAKVNNPTPPATALRIQTSVQGRPIAIGWGQNRLSGNLVWYGDFYSLNIAQAAAQAGKGGSGGGGGKGSSGQTQTNYYASVVIALGAGPIAGVLSLWNNKSQVSLAEAGFSALLGGYAQSPWGYLSGAHPDQADAYRGIALLVGNLQLGNSTELPNYSAEVLWSINSAVPALGPDADPRDVVVDVLTSAHEGIGWPANRLGTLDLYSSYCRATGLLVSPLITEQKAANSFLKDLIEATNAEFRWSNGVLDIIPRGDRAIVANGASYMPGFTPVYDLVDFQPNQGSAGNGAGTNGQPIICVVNDQAQLQNWIKLSYNDRSNSYNPVTIDAKDQASIDVFKPRWTEPKPYAFFALAAAAQQSAQLALGRAQMPRTFTFTLGAEYILLDPMDVVTLTRGPQGLNRQGVLIVEIQENSDQTLTITAEEFLGTAAAPLYGHQASAGYLPNYNVDPGNINPPIIFEPTDELAGGLQIWAAICGIDTALWGGAIVYASYDNISFNQVGVRVQGPARMGVLSAPLAPVTVNPIGQTIDQGDTLSVDLTQSAGTLASGTVLDATSLNTACYVDGEIVAYETATLTATSKYDLTYLVRGAFGTEGAIVTHAAGAKFARLDQGIAKIPFDQSRIGAKVYLKFQSFNVWGGGFQDRSNLPVYVYTITGSALYSPLPNVSNLRTAYLDGRTKIDWDEIDDFRAVMYEIRLGASWAAGLTLGTQAHPPFSVPGDGTYWVAALSQPAAGRIIYSETPVSISVQGALISGNILVQWDEAATGWAGTFTGGAGKDATINAIRTGGGGNILTDPNVLTTPNVLDYGGETSGYYEIPPAHWIDAGYNTQLALGVAYQGQGVPVGQNILAISDFLNAADILGGASTQYTDVHIEVAIAQDSTLDVFAPSDIFAEPDVFHASITWSAWQKFTPGVYPGRVAKFRAFLGTIDPNTIAYLIKLIISALIPARVDQVNNVTVPSTGLAIIFQPNGTTTQRPFNGGPKVSGSSSNAASPAWNGSITNASPGDDIIVQNLTLSGCTVFVQNGGVNVTRAGVNLQFFGY